MTQNEFLHPFQSMFLEAVKIPPIKSLWDIAKENGGKLFVQDLQFGPRADQHAPGECIPLILNLLSVSAHNDWLRQKVVMSLYGADAQSAFPDLAGRSKDVIPKTKLQKVVEDKASDDLKACLERIEKDAQGVSAVRNLFAHGVFGHTRDLEGYFFVFEPVGLTEAHARYTTYDHQADYPFAQDPMQDIQERFDRSLPHSDCIKIWNKEMLEEVLEACDGFRRAWSVILESLKPHPMLRADRSEVYKILSEYGAVTVDLQEYFLMRWLYHFECGGNG